MQWEKAMYSQGEQIVIWRVEPIERTKEARRDLEDSVFWLLLERVIVSVTKVEIGRVQAGGAEIPTYTYHAKTDDGREFVQNDGAADIDINAAHVAHGQQRWALQVDDPEDQHQTWMTCVRQPPVGCRYVVDITDPFGQGNMT